MKRSNTGLLIAILSVGILVLVALVLNLSMGGLWIVKGLDGETGKSAYDLAVENGFSGSVTEWLASLGGNGGKSAYEIALENGFVGSEREWLLSLAYGEDGKDGKDGADGADGEDGRNGRDGEDGQDGADGVGLRSVMIDASGHLIVYLTDGTRVDAGLVGGQVTSTEENDFTKAQAAGYTGTRVEWLRGLHTGEYKGADGKALSVSEAYLDASGHLRVAMSDGETVLDAGSVSADGYLSESLEQYNMRPRFETVVLNWENASLNLRTIPDTLQGPILQSYPAGTEFLCIGRGEVTEDDEFCMILFSDGKIGYARSKFFEIKHLAVTGAEGMNLPASLTLTAGKSMRLVGAELVPWADATCLLSMEASDGLTVGYDAADGSFSLQSDTAGVYTLSVLLYRPMTVGIQVLDALDVTVTVTSPKTVSGLTGLFIGDSRIAPGVGISASLPRAVAERLPDVEWLGTQTNADGLRCEGLGGRRVSDLTVDGKNPFFDPDKKAFSFDYYCTQTGKRPDFAVICLGANDLYSNNSAKQLRTIADAIAATGTRVFVLTEYVIAPAEGGGFGDDVRSRLSFAYFDRLTAAFAGAETNGIYLIPNFLSVGLTDSDRADYIHLTAAGYAHEADVIATYLGALLGS